MKYIKDLDNHELSILLDKNKKLYNMVSNNLMDDGDFWINDRIEMLDKSYYDSFDNNRVIDYNIDYSSSSYIKVNDKAYSIYYNNLLSYANNTGLEIDTNFMDLVERFGYLIKQQQIAIDYHLTVDYFNYEKLEKDIDEVLTKINDTIVIELLKEYDFTNDDMIMFIKEDINNQFDNIYIKDDSYIAYETVPSIEVSYEK
jgi:hypothetical protein